MNRYIDVDAVTKEPWFVEFRGDTIDDIAEQIIKACKHIVKTAPTIDIVRCKECKHWCKGDDVYGICNRCTNTRQMRFDDFCSYGERSEE